MDLCSVKRPDFGKLGRPLKVYANHFIVEVPKTGYFYHYDVTIELVKGEELDDAKVSPAGTPKRKLKEPSPLKDDAKASREPPRVSKELKRKIFRLFLQADPGKVMNGTKPAFDGEKNMYTMKELKIARGDSKSAEVVVPMDADGQERRARVAIKPCEPLMTSWAMLQAACEGKTKEVPIVVFQCINTVFREAALATQHNIAVGRSIFWYDKDTVKDLTGGRESWAGFYASARPCQWSITLNLDVANGAFYEALPVLQFMVKVLSMDQAQNRNQSRAAVPSALTDADRKKFEREIKTLKVQTNYIHGQVRRYRVMRLAREPASKHSFLLDGRTITVANYFAERYQMKLNYPGLPCLEVGGKGNLIPIELASIAPGQKVIKKLTDDQTTILVRHCANPAPQRRQRIAEIRNKVVNYDNSEHLQHFGIKVNGTMKELEARVLPIPVMAHGTPDPKVLKELNVNGGDGTWDPRNARFITPKDIEAWYVICLDDASRLPLDQFFGEMKRCGAVKGMMITDPKFENVRQSNPDFPAIIRAAKDRWGALDMVMIIMRNRSTIYGEIKKAGDILCGIPTQVVLGKVISKHTEKGMNQLVNNLLLKMNAKLGGVNSTVAVMNTGQKSFNALLKRFVDKPTIVFGADVTHPSPGDGSHKPSIAALVASYNRSYTAYSARVRAQGHREEIVTDLMHMVKELLVEFKNRNKREPQRILFYRDGVSEGQFLQVMKEELTAIQQACLKVAPDGSYKPPITYVIVGKRHHTRLFAANLGDTVGKAQNVPPGTITDRGMCHFSEFDWFCCSHAGIQGTSRPAHYNVLYDDTGYKADEIQLFSYYLTYCYARCNRSVSIPAPVYYAHHVAFRARHHLQEVEGSSNSGGDNNHGNNRGAPNIDALNAKIRTHEKLTGMYFA